MMDRALESTFVIQFTTQSFATNIATTLLGSPVLSVLESGNATPITAGVSISVDRASVTGLNEATIVATTANGYETDKTYALYISTGTVNSVSVVGVIVGEFRILETGFLPATQAQVNSIGAASGGAFPIQVTEDNLTSPIKGIDNVGTETGTFANTEADDASYHVLTHDTNDIDWIYGFDIQGGRTAVRVRFKGFLNSNNDDMLLQAFDFVGTDWETVKLIPGQNGSADIELTADLLLKHTGTGVDLGKVYIRLEADGAMSSPVMNVNLLHVDAVNIGVSVGYANGQVWLNTVSGVAGTEAFVNGVADNPTNLIASAKTIATSVGLSDFHVINGSTVLLAESTVNESYFGDNWTLQLGGQDVAGAYFQGPIVTGVGVSAAEVHYEGCEIGTMSVQIGHFDFCSFGGTVTMTLTGDYNYHNSYSMVAGPGGPTFAKTAGQTITAQWRNWAGSINITGLELNDTLTIGGRLGTVDLGSPAVAAVVEIRGTYKEITNIGSAAVNSDGAINVGAILDEVNTGATHNVTNSLGRQIRETRETNVYADNRIWIDTINGAAGTTDFENGTLDNPVDSIDDANTLAASLGINRFMILNGSSITFVAGQTSQNFFGDNWTLALGGQSIVGTKISGATVTGIASGTGTLQIFENCRMGAVSYIKDTHIQGCSLSGTQTLVEAGDIFFDQCHSAVAGMGSVTFDFGAALNSSNLNVRHHSGGWTIANMGAGTGTYEASFEGDGQIIWAASCSATSNASIRGNWKITDQASGAVTETLDDNQTGVDAIKTETDKLVFSVANELDVNIKSVIEDPVKVSSSKTTRWGGTP